MKIKKIKLICVASALGLLLSTSANAQTVHTQNKPKNQQLRYNLKVDMAVTAITAAGFLGTTAFGKQLAPSSCRWCGVNGFDEWGHNNLAWSNSKAANVTSHVTAFALAPMAAFGLDALAASHDGRLNEFPIDALLIAEAASVAAITTQIFKFSTGRQRPDAHYSSAGSTSGDDNTSFYSAHTSIAFSLAVSSGTIATMRGYRYAPLIWGSGLAIAATTGYLRIAADKHYLTDVIAGSVIGSAMGFLIPYIFHRPMESNGSDIMVSVAQVTGGGLLTLQGTF